MVSSRHGPDYSRPTFLSYFDHFDHKSLQSPGNANPVILLAVRFKLMKAALCASTTSLKLSCWHGYSCVLREP
ncbi:MAG: hypothetical protein KDA91_23825, partial [Planctomycetaceae bacterium]|nr:hypothetical protein [Planctomycetaceae bacterium]